ncbi:MAG: hypothetical protein ACPGSD_04835 [Flavobacteriales bacterium]
MNKLRFSIFFLLQLIMQAVLAQNFEGIISYQTSYKSKIEGMSTVEIFGQKTAKDTTYFKDGYSLNISSTDFMHYQLWRSVDTAIYFFHASNPDTIWFDKTYSHPTIYDSMHVDLNVERIEGFSCNKLTVYLKDKCFEYYYHPNFVLDPKYYQNYWNSSTFEIVKIMKSPYLRLKMSTPNCIIELRAESIEQTQLSDSIFSIPEGVKTKVLYSFK